MFGGKKPASPTSLIETPGVVQKHELKHDGYNRSFLVYVPRSAPAANRTSGSAAGHMDHSATTQAADALGFVAVLPNGWHPLFAEKLLTWNAAPGKCGPSAKRNIDDVGFLVRVIDLCLDTYPLIDRRRVFVAGHSNGGMMAYRLAASVEGSRRIAAIAPVAGCACLPPTLFQPTRAVPVLHIHSVDDPRALYNGGEGPPFPMTKSTVFHDPVPDTIAQWVAFNGCNPTPYAYPTESLVQACGAVHSVTRFVYSGGRDGAQVVLVRLTGAGHGWPGEGRSGRPLEKVIGPATKIVDAYREMWAFFVAHPMPIATSAHEPAVATTSSSMPPSF